MKNKKLNERMLMYCQQRFDQSQDNGLSLKIAVMAPLALLANETALAQCNTGTLSDSGGFYNIDVDNDGNPDFIIDDGYAPRLWFTLANNSCSVAVDTGNGWNGYTSLFQSAAAPIKLTTSNYLPIQNFVPRTALNYNGSTHGYGALNTRGGVWPNTPMSGYVGVRCDYDGDGNYNYGFYHLDFNAGGNVTVDLTKSGIDEVDDNIGIVGYCESIGGVGPLPVELVKLDARYDTDQVVINWETATEINNMGFRVQRSTNGRDFHNVGWVDGYGTTTEEQNYLLVDKELPTSSVLYYRLVQTDFDGATELSDVVSVNISSDGDAVVSEFQPNLFRPGVNTSLIIDLLENNNDVDIRVFNANGQLFRTFNYRKDSGKHIMAFETFDLPSGVFYASVNINGETFHRKFFIQE